MSDKSQRSGAPAEPSAPGPNVALVSDRPPADELPGLESGEEPPQPGSDSPSGEAPRRRRRRRNKPEEPAAPAPVDPTELAQLQQSFRAGFSVILWFLSKSRGAHWMGSQEEINMLGDQWGLAMINWLPAWLRATSPLMVALGTTVAYAWPRVQTDLENAEKRAANPPGADISAEVVPDKPKS